LFSVLLLGGSLTVLAGPPFVTDDPEPVAYQHWEIYTASQPTHDRGGWSGTLPHFEVNYGAVPNLQLHLIAPVAFSAPNGGITQFGYGDTELGMKYRFVKETDYLPQIGTFPLVELPTGDHARGLGSGNTDVFLPIWLQKSFGKWTTYGGGGYWINPGQDNRNWWYAGWLLQRQITEHFTLGAEIFHETTPQWGGSSNTKMNGGGIWDLSDRYHILFSAGHTVQGPSSFIGYVAFQITFGPETPKGK
jgi:hypothetical protein